MKRLLWVATGVILLDLLLCIVFAYGGYCLGEYLTTLEYQERFNTLKVQVERTEQSLRSLGLSKDCLVTWEQPTTDSLGVMGMYVCRFKEDKAIEVGKPF